MMETKPPPRPYTEYNIFFQVEREYILQNLGVVPPLKPEEVFVCSDKNYKGPEEMPPRYKDVILPSDWYIPGKSRRKKRQHRASHGKISFTDLSKSIASAWRNIDGETKLFCAQLSDIGMQEYKREMQKYNRVNKQLAPPTATKDSESKAHKKIGTKQSHSGLNREAFKFDPNIYANNANTAPAEKSTMKKPEEKIVTKQSHKPSNSADLLVKSDNSINGYNPPTSMSSAWATWAIQAATVPSAPSAPFNPFTCAPCKPESNSNAKSRDQNKNCVDLQDDDILNMWKSG
ncbi:hypothetical protein ACHAXR_004942 [Thalassiosira sp. AJA248-18]